MTTASRPVDAPVCASCGQFYVDRPKGSAYSILKICRQCNGERPHGPPPFVSAVTPSRPRSIAQFSAKRERAKR